MRIAWDRGWGKGVDWDECWGGCFGGRGGRGEPHQERAGSTRQKIPFYSVIITEMRTVELKAISSRRGLGKVKEKVGRLAGERAKGDLKDQGPAVGFLNLLSSSMIDPNLVSGQDVQMGQWSIMTVQFQIGCYPGRYSLERGKWG